MSMVFFPNCKDFDVSGGEFYYVQGNNKVTTKNDKSSNVNGNYNSAQYQPTVQAQQNQYYSNLNSTTPNSSARFSHTADSFLSNKQSQSATSSSPLPRMSPEELHTARIKLENEVRQCQDRLQQYQQRLQEYQHRLQACQYWAQIYNKVEELYHSKAADSPPPRNTSQRALKEKEENTPTEVFQDEDVAAVTTDDLERQYMYSSTAAS